MFKAILFDMDDLMVDSAPFHMEASKRAFMPYGIDVDKIPPDVVANFFGQRVSEIIEFTVEYFGMKGQIDPAEIAHAREAIFLDLVDENLEAMPGLMKLIEEIKKTNLKRAVASSGLKIYVEKVLNKFDLTDFFEAIASGDMVDHGKPEPDIFLKAAELLGVDPKDCIVVEDAMHGVDAAHKAGMFCIGVQNSKSKFTQDLSKADLVVNRLDEIDIEKLMGLQSLSS